MSRVVTIPGYKIEITVCMFEIMDIKVLSYTHHPV